MFRRGQGKGQGCRNGLGNSNQAPGRGKAHNRSFDSNN